MVFIKNLDFTAKLGPGTMKKTIELEKLTLWAILKLSGVEIKSSFDHAEVSYFSFSHADILFFHPRAKLASGTFFGRNRDCRVTKRLDTSMFF